jgi:tetratricopeptide (TPR) repeat protein
MKITYNFSVLRWFQSKKEPHLDLYFRGKGKGTKQLLFFIGGLLLGAVGAYLWISKHEANMNLNAMFERIKPLNAVQRIEGIGSKALLEDPLFNSIENEETGVDHDLKSIEFKSNLKIEIHPDASQNLEQQAYQFSKKGQLQEAYEIYQILLRQDPQNISFLFSQGLILQKLGSIEQAEKRYHQILKLDLNHSQAWINLLKIQFDQSSQIKEKKIQLLENKNIHFLPVQLQKAIILETLGRPQEALSILKGVIPFLPRNAVVYFYIGILQDRLKNSLGALLAYEQALSLDSQGAFLPIVQIQNRILFLKAKI